MQIVAPLLLLLAVQGGPAVPHIHDRIVELEIEADDPTRIDGKHQIVAVEHEVAFEGTLNVWTESELALVLRVEPADERRALGEDDGSGGAKTPFVRLEVHEGDRLLVLVASEPEASGPLRLHLMAAPESEATRAAATRGDTAIREAGRLVHEGDRDAARALLDETEADLSKTPGADDSQRITDCRRRLARSLFDLGDPAAARGLFEAALANLERTFPEDHLTLLVARLDLAISMHAMGDLDDARSHLEAVLAGCARTLPEDHRLALLTKINLAHSRHAMGDLAGARALREDVLAADERIFPPGHPERLRAQVDMATSMRAMGDFTGARSLLEGVVAGYEHMLPEDHPNRLAAQFNLAVLMNAMGDHADARRLWEAVLAGYERTLPEDHSNLFRARGNLAESMHATGDGDGARALFEAVLEGFEQALPEDHPDVILARATLAFSTGATGDLAGARAQWEAVLAAYERTLPEDHHDRLSALDALAHAMVAMDDLSDARALVPALAAGMQHRVLASLALAPRQAIGTVASESDRLATVVMLSESGTPTLERIAFELIETLRLVAGEAARSLSRLETDPELAPIRAEAASVRSALHDLVTGAARAGPDAKGAEEVAEELTRLTLRRDAIEREASRRLAERGIVTRAVEAEALAAALEDGDAAVGYRRIRGHVLAHVLTADGALTRVDLGPATELEDLAGAWRAALRAPLVRGDAQLRGRALGQASSRSGEVAAGRELRERLLDPVLAATGEGTARLFVCADDLVFLVPLDGLPLGEGEVAEDGDLARVGDRLRIANEVTFARLLSPSGPVGAGPSLLAVGGIDYDAEGVAPTGPSGASPPIDRAGAPAQESEAGATRSALLDSFQALQQTRDEAETTAHLFQEVFGVEPALLTGTASTKAALSSAAPGARYLHLATHGWFAPESVKSILDAPAVNPAFVRMSFEDRITGLAPMTLCGLALAGANRGRDTLGRVPGILTAEELCSLDLSRCELAVLSACETNVGIRRAGQGIQSLQAALYAAGARSSVTSLWKVDDAATRRLFEVFYTNLWVEKLPKARALWEAKCVLRREGAPVRDWAGWVLTGDPD